MALLGRRRRAAGGAPGEALDDEVWPGDEVAGPTTEEAAPEQPARPAPADDGPPNLLRRSEARWAGAVAVLLIGVGIAMLVDTTGAGAPKHPSPLWAALVVVAGVATLVSLPRRNRIISAGLPFVGGFFASVAKVPTALGGARFAAFVAPVAFAFLIFRRQSKADRVRRQAERAAAGPATRGGRPAPGGRRGSTAVVKAPRGARPSGRYTPPKQRRTRR